MPADNPEMFHRIRAGRLPGRYSTIAIIVLATAAALAEVERENDTSAGDGQPGTHTEGALSTRSERERMLLELIDTDALPDEILVIGDQDATFIARFESAQGPEPEGALLYVPARGAFVGTDALADALLREFPGTGWSVLAVQPPLLDRVADLDDYDAFADSGARRVRDAIQFLVDEGNTRIIVAGNADGATLVWQCLASGVPHAVVAFAALGNWSGEVDERPLLELIGDRDTRGLAPSTRRMKEAARSAPEQYERVVLGGADERFLGFEREIARRIRGWLDRITLDTMSLRVP